MKRFHALLFIAALATQLGLAVPAFAQTERAIWTREIRTDLVRSRTGISPLLSDRNRGGVLFVGNDRVLAYAIDHDPGQLSARKSPDVHSPFRLKVWLIDAKSGEIQSSRDWGTRVQDTDVQATAGGVLIRRGDLFSFHSPDLIQTQQLPISFKQSGYWITTVSPSGNTVLLNRVDQQTRSSHIEVLDGTTLKVKTRWDEIPPLFRDYSISDVGIVAAVPSGHSLAIAPFGGGSWKTVELESMKKCFVSSPVMLTDDSFVVQQCRELLRVARDGKVQRIGDVNGATSSKVAVSRDGRFLAVSLDNMSITKHLLTEPTIRVVATSVAVYDTLLHKCILTQEVSPLPKNDYDIALSPDGSRLVILADRKLSVYLVPHSD